MTSSLSPSSSSSRTFSWKKQHELLLLGSPTANLVGLSYFYLHFIFTHHTSAFLRAPLIAVLKAVKFDPVTRCIMKTSLMKSLVFFILFNMSIWCLLHQRVLTPRCRQRLQSCQLSHPLSSLASLFLYIYCI